MAAGTKYSRVTLTKSVDVYHAWLGDYKAPTFVRLCKGAVYGDVEGHIAGVLVTPMLDGTFSFILKTDDGTEIWTGIPADAFEATPYSVSA